MESTLVPKTMLRGLRPYFISSNCRPDLWVSISMDNWEYPLLMVEILSKENIDLTVGESERSLIHQLRLYDLTNSKSRRICY